MRVVVDTNVLVSGLLSPFGTPGIIVDSITAGRLTPCYDSRMLIEYSDVLRRPEFPFVEQQVATLLSRIKTNGELIAPAPLQVRLPDPDDEPFLEVAVAGMVEFLITGNIKHFLTSEPLAVQILSPREFLDKGLEVIH